MPTSVWTDADLTNPHGAADKAARVQAMFSAIAPTYDLNNRLHSLGCDQTWRRAAVRLAGVRPTDMVLDVACGTGDLALLFHRAGAARVIGVDFTYNMLEIAARKRPTAECSAQRPAIRQEGFTLDRCAKPQGPSFVTGDAMRLPVADATVDIVSIAFGLRNVADPVTAIREFYRVLRPGGRLIVLEFSQPTNPVFRRLYNFYFHQVLPRTAAWIARDRAGAYRYLPRSVSTFLDRPALARLLTEVGFGDIAQQPLTLGIAVVHRGVKKKGR